LKIRLNIQQLQGSILPVVLSLQREQNPLPKGKNLVTSIEICTTERKEYAHCLFLCGKPSLCLIVSIIGLIALYKENTMKFTKTLLTTALFSLSVFSTTQIAYAETNNAELVEQAILSDGEQLKRVMEAFEREEFDTVISLAQPLAAQGNVMAQSVLGFAYASREEYFQAFKWYQKAAEQGDASAQNNLGIMYVLGQGVKQDLNLAKMWTGKACDNGNPKGCDTYRMLNEGK
ncbi:tetratricopeptide repeat protein, partial [Avibacterium paragallinarum]